MIVIHGVLVLVVIGVGILAGLSLGLDKLRALFRSSEKAARPYGPVPTGPPPPTEVRTEATAVADQNGA